MKEIFIFKLFFLQFMLFSQENVIESRSILNSISSTNLINGSGTWVNGKVEDKTILGSTYLFPSWTGVFNVVSNEGNEYKLFNLNYNIKNKTLESLISSDSVYQYDISKINFIKFNNLKYNLYSNKNSQNLNGLYQELFSSNDLILLKEFKIDLVIGAINPLTQEKVSNNEYVKFFNYFLKNGDKLNNIKLNKKNLMLIFENKKDLIKDYVNKNSLSFSNESDVIKIFNYYSSI